MKKSLCLVCAAALLAAKPAFGYIPVLIDAIVDPMFLESQASQVANMVATAKQTLDLYNEAQQMRKIVGDPKSAVSMMIDTREMTDYLNRQLSGGKSYLSDIPGLDQTQGFMHDLNGGVQVRLRLLPGDPNSAARDDQRIADSRKIVKPDGTTTEGNPDLYRDLDEAEAIGRATKAALAEQAKAREEAGRKLAEINDAMSRASTESEKQALAAQYSALAAQMAMLNGMLQHQQFTYELQRDRDQRLADSTNLTDTNQATTDAAATTAVGDQQQGRAEQNLNASRTVVQGNPINLDYSQIK